MQLVCMIAGRTTICFDHVNMFRPVGGTNDVNLDNMLTYVDPIGKYMEVKDIKNLLLFGQKYTIAEDGAPLYYDKSGNLMTDADTGSRNYAYVQQNYRITDARENLVLNPCYTDEEHEVYFDLSKIEIYTKTTWDFRDPDIEDGNIRSDTGGDQSLYINIPVLALPVQKATIQLDAYDRVESYETNLNDPDQSRPLRVFYTVGVVDEVKTDPTKPNSAIDLAKLSPDYVNENRNESTGEVYLYSNWYNSKKDKYTHYVTGEETGYTFGDAVITFSPDTDNSYYRYQEYLPIYDENDQTITSIDPEKENILLQDYMKEQTMPQPTMLLIEDKARLTQI